MIYLKTAISSKGHVVLPIELRLLDNIQPGQQFTFEQLRAGEYLLRKTVVPERNGMVTWLRIELTEPEQLIVLVER